MPWRPCSAAWSCCWPAPWPPAASVRRQMGPGGTDPPRRTPAVELVHLAQRGGGHLHRNGQRPWFARAASGTPALVWWLRALGAKIGRGTWCESYWLPEADLVTLGRNSTVNRGCVVQTHLFHDRVMSIDTVTLEDGATMGPHGVILPQASVGDGGTVGPASLVMRGETVPAATYWMGNPVSPWSGPGPVAQTEVSPRPRTIGKAPPRSATTEGRHEFFRISRPEAAARGRCALPLIRTCPAPGPTPTGWSATNWTWTTGWPATGSAARRCCTASPAPGVGHCAGP